MMEFVAQGADRGTNVQHAQGLLKLHDLRFNYQLRALRLAFTLANVRRDYGLQVVYIEHKYVGKFTHRRIDISRNADVDKERRSIPSLAQSLASHGFGDHILLGRSRTDYDVRLRQVIS